jgi:hypothetical protein
MKVYCLNATTGALVWSYKTDVAVWSSPAVVNGVVFVGSYDDLILAFGPVPPTVSISPTSATMDVNQSQTFTSRVSGGSGGYSYQWYVNTAPIATTTSAAWTFTPRFAGSYIAVYVKMTDSLGTWATSNIATVNVNGLPSVIVLPSSVVMNVGQSRLFTFVVSGGTSPYSYQWYLNGTIVFGATGSTWTFTPASAGSYTVQVSLEDYVGVIANSNVAPLTVNPALPESPPYIILLLVIIAILLAALLGALVLKRKRSARAATHAPPPGAGAIMLPHT